MNDRVIHNCFQIAAKCVKSKPLDTPGTYLIQRLRESAENGTAESIKLSIPPQAFAAIANAIREHKISLPIKVGVTSNIPNSCYKNTSPVDIADVLLSSLLTDLALLQTEIELTISIHIHAEQNPG